MIAEEALRAATFLANEFKDKGYEEVDLTPTVTIRQTKAAQEYL